MKCELCLKEHNGSFGSGRFCSRQCQIKWCGIKSGKRSRKEKTAQKTICPVCKKEFRTQGAFRKHRAETRHYKGKKVTRQWQCIVCKEIFPTRRLKQQHYKEVHHLGKSWNKGLTKNNSEVIREAANHLKERYQKGELIPYHKGRKMSIESRKKMSIKKKDGYAKGLVQGWTSRKIISFPEKYWMDELNRHNISYKHNAPISRKKLGIQKFGVYFLDFLICDKIDLEIDGAQHNLEERKQSDEERDRLLKNSGYIVYRVKWNEIKTPQGKSLMSQKVNAFIDWLKENSIGVCK